MVMSLWSSPMGLTRILQGRTTLPLRHVGCATGNSVRSRGVGSALAAASMIKRQRRAVIFERGVWYDQSWKLELVSVKVVVPPMAGGPTLYVRQVAGRAERLIKQLSRPRAKSGITNTVHVEDY